MTEFIAVELNLPNHENELSNAAFVLEKINIRFNKLFTDNCISGPVHTLMYEEIIRVLDYVGRLSMPVFDIEANIEEKYCKQYLHAPELAKKLWMDHYEQIHHPYNIMKNRCFRLLEDLDALYFKANKKSPPNWKI